MCEYVGKVINSFNGTPVAKYWLWGITADRFQSHEELRVNHEHIQKQRIYFPNVIGLQNSPSLQKEAFDLENELPLTRQTPSICLKAFRQNVHRYVKISITITRQFVPSLPSLGSLCLSARGGGPWHKPTGH
jgi:hypothetical protein